MKKLVFLSLFLAGMAADAQQAVVANISGPVKNEGLNFPVITLADKNVSRKINEYLQVNVLEQTTLKTPGMQVFDKVKWTENKPGMDELDYTVLRNNSKFLSLDVSSDWLSAYSTENHSYFLFNVQNGEIILLEDIINPVGLKELEKDIKRKRNILIAANLKELKSDADAVERIDNIKSSYADCNSDADMNNFYVSGEQIIFHRTPCLPHVIQSMDTDLDITYSIDSIRPLLTPFGQRLFSPAKQDISKDRFPSLSKPLRGKIDNKYEVVMQLHIDADNSVDGFYYYSNYQSAIQLSGQLVNGQLELKEKDAEFNDTAVIKLDVSGTRLRGTWTSIKTGKALPFAAGN
jgi:hypothetical protein